MKPGEVWESKSTSPKSRYAHTLILTRYLGEDDWQAELRFHDIETKYNFAIITISGKEIFQHYTLKGETQ